MSRATINVVAAPPSVVAYLRRARDLADQGFAEPLLGKGSLSAVGLAVDDCPQTHDDLVAKGMP